MSFTAPELPREIHEAMARLKVQEAQTTGNSMRMIEAILLADEKKFCRPPEADAFVIEGFRRWYDSQGTISLDEAFGIKPSDGKRHPFHQKFLEERNEMLFLKVALLKAVGAKTAEAAEMVARGFEECKDWNQTKWRMPETIMVETLLRLYSRCPRRTEREYDCGIAVSSWSMEQRRDFLCGFPCDSMPHRFKQRLRKMKERFSFSSGLV